MNLMDKGEICANVSQSKFNNTMVSIEKRILSARPQGDVDTLLAT